MGDLPVYPTTADLDRMKGAARHLGAPADLESWVGVMPRYGSVDEMRWFKGQGCVGVPHDQRIRDGERIHMDALLAETCAFPFMREARRHPSQPVEIRVA